MQQTHLVQKSAEEVRSIFGEPADRTAPHILKGSIQKGAAFLFYPALTVTSDRYCDSDRRIARIIPSYVSLII